MAGKSKTLHVVIADRKTHRTVERRVFFKAKDANDWIKTVTEQEKDSTEQPKYPLETHYVHKEML